MDAVLKRLKSDPRQVRAQDFPGDGTLRERLLFLLRYAILAPSFRNTQPWKFSVDGHRIAFFADRTRWLVASDPDARDLRLSVGCALENLVVAARHFGYDPKVDYVPRTASPDLLAVVDLSRHEAVHRRRDAELDPMLRRRTLRNSPKRAVPPPALYDDLEAAFGQEDGRLIVSENAAVRSTVAMLYRHAALVQLSDERVRDEISQWMPAVEYGVPRWMTHFGGLALPRVEQGILDEAGHIERAPSFGVIATAVDDAEAQVRAGQAVERAWLAATRHRVAILPASILCAVAATRSQLARAMEVPAGMHVQFAFRLGHYDEQGPRTSRRRVEGRVVPGGPR